MTLTKSERRIVLLLGIIITTLQIIIVYQRPRPSTMPIPVEIDQGEEQKYQNTSIEKDSLPFTPGSINNRPISVVEISDNYEKVTDKIYYPNQMDSIEWRSLGLKPYVCRNILRYRKAGGIFNNPGDLKKIYYIDTNIINKYINQFDFEKHNPTIKEQSSQAIQKVDINNADTSELKQLKGIGSVLSRRIIKYRKLLGGFTHTQQLLEVYGIDKEILIKNDSNLICSGHLKKVNLNNATKDSLQYHPYFRGKVASWIINYREQHGSFTDLEEIKNISQISDSIYSLIKPYCTVE